MKVHDALDGVLRGRGSLALLRIFCKYPGTSFTGRELAKLAHLSVSHVQSSLENLEVQGLVEKGRAGNSLMWKARPSNLLFQPLQRLLSEERELPELLIDRLRGGLRRARFIRATLFGSVARGEESPESDVDLLLELASATDRPALEPIMLRLGDQVRDEFGLNLSPTYLSPIELKRPSWKKFRLNVQAHGQLIASRP